MEELLYMILRGLMIGVVVSAPMGPVGIFCIQRTLDKGRLSGLYTGVGAAISDLIYCLLTGFCLSFIEEFIDSHRAPIQLLGSVVLIAFGIWLIRKKPDGSLSADPDHDNPSREGDILKGFALTFSNPLILFLIIGLFAQFNFVIEGIKFYHYMLGFLGIIAGALGWWWVVTFFVDKLRGHFNQRTMKLINTVVGFIILIFAAAGIFSSVTTLVSASELPMPSAKVGERVDFRVADIGMKGWHAEFSDSVGNGFRLEVCPLSRADAFGDTQIDAISVRALALPSGEELSVSEVMKGIDPYRGANSWRIVRGESGWLVFVGNREYQHVMTVPTRMGSVGNPKIEEFDGGKIVKSAIAIIGTPSPIMKMASADELSALNSDAYKKNDIAGIYTLYEYEHDDSYARIGGNYRIGVIPSDSSENYVIIYIDGGKVNSDLWSYGMVKGRLKATPFAGIFDVEWIDAEGDVMKHDVSADFDGLTSMLSIKFPYQRSLLKFRKE